MELWTQIIVAGCAAFGVIAAILSFGLGAFLKTRDTLKSLQQGVTEGLQNDKEIKGALHDGTERFQRIEHSMQKQDDKITHLEKNVINAQNLLIQNIIGRLEKLEAKT